METAVKFYNIATGKPEFCVATLLDTGAHVSVMQQKVYERLGGQLDQLMRCQHQTILGVGSTVPILGGAFINVSIESKKFCQYFHVIKDLPETTPIILGLDFMQLTEPNFDFANNLVCFGETKAQLGPPRSAYCGKVRLLESIRFKPGEVKDIVFGQLINAPDTTVFAENPEIFITPFAKQFNKKGIHVIPSISPIFRNNCVALRMACDSNRKCVLRKNTIVADAAERTSCLESRPWHPKVVTEVLDGHILASEAHEACHAEFLATTEKFQYMCKQSEATANVSHFSAPSVMCMGGCQQPLKQCNTSSDAASVKFMPTFKEKDGIPTFDASQMKAAEPVEDYFPPADDDNLPDPMADVDEGSALELGSKWAEQFDTSTELDDTIPEHMKKVQKSEIIQIGTENLTADQTDIVKQSINDNGDVFALCKLDLKITDKAVHRIHLTDDTPIKLPPYKLAHKKYEWCRETVKGLLNRGLISKSTSPYSFPVVLATKKGTDELRFCVDYRELNERTVKDAFPLPTCDSVFHRLNGVKFLSSLDLQSACWQCLIAKEDRHKTAFVTPFGLYEFNVMPFGLTNAPATFQRVMHAIFGDMIEEGGVFVYLDDILIFTETSSCLI